MFPEFHTLSVTPTRPLLHPSNSFPRTVNFEDNALQELVGCLIARFIIHHDILVGGWATPLKNMNVNWDDDIPNISGKIKHVSKPPTSIGLIEDG